MPLTRTPSTGFARSTVREAPCLGRRSEVLTVAEEEARHRRELERRLVEASVQASRWGQILAFLIAMVSLGAVILSVLLEQVAGAIAPAILAITSLVATFVGSRREE